MLRIVGIQHSDNAGGEFVLLRNQGALKRALKGHLLANEEYFTPGNREGISYVFSDEVDIPASCYVAIVSGPGQNGWRKSLDGSLVYYSYWGRAAPVWSRHEPLHLLHVVQTSRPRPEGLALTR